MKILTLGNFPMIKDHHPADDDANYGYLILSSAPKNLLFAENAYYAAIGFELPSNHPKEFKRFLKVASPFVIGASFPDWKKYLASWDVHT